MAASTQESLAAAVHHAASQYHRLVLLVGPPASGKTAALNAYAAATAIPVLNASLLLAEHLLDLPLRGRPGAVQRQLAALLKESGSPTVALDNLELVFSQDLALDPLRLLQGVSRNHTVIAAWSGAFQDGALTCAEPGHPEWRRYTHVEATVVTPAHSEEKP